MFFLCFVCFCFLVLPWFQWEGRNKALVPYHQELWKPAQSLEGSFHPSSPFLVTFIMRKERVQARQLPLGKTFQLFCKWSAHFLGFQGAMKLSCNEVSHVCSLSCHYLCWWWKPVSSWCSLSAFRHPESVQWNISHIATLRNNCKDRSLGKKKWIREAYEHCTCFKGDWTENQRNSKPLIQTLNRSVAAR